MRLDKRVAAAGYTRTEARAIIRAGRVAMAGQIIRDAGQNVSADVELTLDGAPLDPFGPCHLMMYKPAGVLTATEDARGATTVFDLLPHEWQLRRPGPVGRLDKDVTGLVLMTTDGQLAHRLISPKWEVAKRYVATVDGRLTEADVRRFAAGVALSDFVARPAELVILASDAVSVARVIVTEGKFHQVKRMFQAIDRKVLTLHRESIGPVELDPTLSPGASRRLTDEETTALYRATEGIV